MGARRPRSWAHIVPPAKNKNHFKLLGFMHGITTAVKRRDFVGVFASIACGGEVDTEGEFWAQWEVAAQSLSGVSA